MAARCAPRTRSARAFSPSSRRRAICAVPRRRSIPRADDRSTLADDRRDAAADAVLPRPRAAARAADDDRAEVLPHAGHRRGRARHLPPDLLRDARQLLVRPVLQGGRDRARDRVHPRPARARLGPHLGERPRRRPGARSSAPTRSRSTSGRRSACRRSGSCRCRRRRTSGRSAGRARAGPTRRSTTTGARSAAAASRLPAGLHALRALPRVLEPRLHGVRAASRRDADTAAEAEHRHRAGPRAHRARSCRTSPSVYDTDGYQPIMAWIAAQSGVAYGDSADATKAHRVLADHGRGMTFLVGDGVRRRTRAAATSCAA